MQALEKSRSVSPRKNRKIVDKHMIMLYNKPRSLGEWCNGNTWVSKTFVEGSNPSSPASRKALNISVSGLFLCLKILFYSHFYPHGLKIRANIGVHAVRGCHCHIIRKAGVNVHCDCNRYCGLYFDTTAERDKHEAECHIEK